jgi:hypothetical protein
MLMVTPISTKIKLSEFEEDGDAIDLEVGFIQAWKFDLSFGNNSLLSVADTLTQELYDVALYFFADEHSLSQAEELSVWDSRYLIYIESVFVEPEYRGNNIGLKAVALFLAGLGEGNTVTGSPYPIGDPGKRTREQTIRALRRYWSKLDITLYSKDYNLIWKADWRMPDWLAASLWEEF